MRCTPATRQSNRNSLSEIAYLAKSLCVGPVKNENPFYFQPGRRTGKVLGRGTVVT